MQGSLERAIGQTLCDNREREQGVKALNQNHFQAQICKTKTLDSLFLTSGFSCRVFPLFLGCKGIWWRVSPSCRFFELSPALQERQREPRHSWAKYLCCHKSNYCFELRLLLPFPFSRRIKSFCFAASPVKPFVADFCGQLRFKAAQGKQSFSVMLQFVSLPSPSSSKHLHPRHGQQRKAPATCSLPPLASNHFVWLLSSCI